MAEQGVELASKLNWLRAGVLGANDGIVSTASVIFGVAGADANHAAVVLAGIAAIAAGALSMATGEYVSVSSQRDVEHAELARKQAEIAAHPRQQLSQLAAALEEDGIDESLACDVATQLSRRDALAAHARTELGIDPAAVVNPWAAAFASLVAFTLGGLFPLIGLVLATRGTVVACGFAVVAALTLTGAITARLGRLPMTRSVLRNIAGGLLAMAVTYGVGHVAGTRL